MITTDGIKEIAQFVLGRIAHGTYDLNDTTNQAPIYKSSIEGSIIKVYLYFDDDISGSFSNFKLISTSGKVFASKPDSIQKPNTKGLLVRFKFEIKEVV